MRLRIVSDLHYEFHADEGVSLTKSIAEGKGFDVLVLAGDITNANCFDRSLRLLIEAVDPKPVVFVLGNHEFYGSSFEHTVSAANALADTFPNFHFLDNSTVEIRGQRFIGSTLWYLHPYWTPQDAEFGDFTQIEEAQNLIHSKALESARYLRNNVQPGDVVVTHYLPHRDSVLPQWRGSPFNSYFLHDIGDVVEYGEAKLWVHGHTHGTLNYVVGQTRVVCNPLGYRKGAPGEPNPKFNERFTIRV